MSWVVRRGFKGIPLTAAQPIESTLGTRPNDLVTGGRNGCLGEMEKREMELWGRPVSYSRKPQGTNRRKTLWLQIRKQFLEIYECLSSIFSWNRKRDIELESSSSISFITCPVFWIKIWKTCSRFLDLWFPTLFYYSSFVSGILNPKWHVGNQWPSTLKRYGLESVWMTSRE